MLWGPSVAEHTILRGATLGSDCGEPSAGDAKSVCLPNRGGRCQAVSSQGQRRRTTAPLRRARSSGFHPRIAAMPGGLPFAASTAGENRRRAPQPVPGRDGWCEAVRFAERCAQMTTRGDKEEGLKPGLVVGSEDCLGLDVYAPADAEGKALPVMVWIHGGYNVWGRSSSYDGSRLAVDGNVIVVAVQYRLGPLGWFAHPFIRESARDPQDAAASFATLDLIASLRWVRDNIDAFGGDAPTWHVYGDEGGNFMRFDTAHDGGVGVMTGAYDVTQVGADLMRAQSVDAEQRCRIVAEMRDWYFARPVRGQLEATTGCGPATALGDRGHQL